MPAQSDADSDAQLEALFHAGTRRCSGYMTRVRSRVPTLILHHFDISPYAEKIRKVLGVKDLEWKSVLIPPVMPKPLLTALTGGYRKTPVLQIGADIYCDTQLIAQTIDRLYPDPPLFAGGRLQGIGLQHWSDAAFFQPGAGLSLFENRAHIPAAITKDRKDYFSFLDFNKFEEDAPHFRSQFRAHARLIEDQLSDGRDFFFGAAPSWADIGGYFNIWMARGNIPSSEKMLAAFPQLLAWRDRMDALGAGRREEMTPEEALDIARSAAPLTAPAHGHAPDESGAVHGDTVAVFATDYGKDAVVGTLSSADDREIVLRRQDATAGEVAVHFPRLGFRIAPSS
jgi:glutathione S-transferase